MALSMRRDTRARQLALTPAGRARLTGALADVEAADAEFFGRVRDPAALVAALSELA